MDGETQQQLRLRIYEATIEEFREKGFKFTMDDMARRLGVSKKTIYQVVRDKETLFFDTATYIYEQIKRSEQAVMDDDSLTTVEKIKAILIAMPDSYSELDWRQIYQLEKSYPRIFARVRVMMEQQWDNTIELLRRGIDEGVIRDIPIPVIKTMFDPLAAKAAADHGKIDPGSLGFLPVHFTLILAHVNAFFGGGQNRLSVTVKVVPGIVLGPRSGTGAGVNGQGGFLPAVAGDQPNHYQRHNGNQHARGQCKTQVGLLLLFGLWAAALRGLGLGLFAVGLAGLLFRLAGLPRRLFVLFHRRFPL